MVSGASDGRFKNRMIDNWGLDSSSVTHVLGGWCWLLAETLTLESIGWNIYTLHLHVSWHSFHTVAGFPGWASQDRDPGGSHIAFVNPPSEVDRMVSLPPHSTYWGSYKALPSFKGSGIDLNSWCRHNGRTFGIQNIDVAVFRKYRLSQSYCLNTIIQIPFTYFTFPQRAG